MRFLRETMVLAAILSMFGIVQAVVGARELERVAPTTRIPALPLSNQLASAGLALMLVLYGVLGWMVARARASASTAAACGALAGFAAGLVAGVAQAALQAGFFRSVLLAYSLSDAFLGVVVAAIVILEPLVGAVVGAGLAWLAHVLFRPSRRTEAA